MGQEHTHILDKYQSFDELEHAMREAGIESIELMMGFDFSFSNMISGKKTYNRNLHDINFNNPYMHIISILQPIVSKFDDDGIIPAFRFGCEQS